MTRLIPSLLLLACIHSAAGADATTFNNMPEFVATLPKAKLLRASASGSFADGKAVYHAQLVESGDERSQQIFVFRLDDSGKYSLVDRSKRMDGMGGSGNWQLRTIEFRNSSLYISFGYQWHQCAGWSENQFRFVDGSLAMIGNESEEENIGEGLTVRSSTNLLTGQGYWTAEKKGITTKHPERRIKGAIPFSAYDGAGWISPYHSKRRVC